MREKTGDLFDSAGALHSNFYEDTMIHEDILRRLLRVGRFVEKVERLLP